MEANNQDFNSEKHEASEQQKWDPFGTLSYTDLPKGKIWTLTELMREAEARLAEKGQEQPEVLDKPAMSQQAEHEAQEQEKEQEATTTSQLCEPIPATSYDGSSSDDPSSGDPTADIAQEAQQDQNRYLEEFHCDGAYASEGDVYDPDEAFLLTLQQILETRMPSMEARQDGLRAAHRGDASLLVPLLAGRMLIDIVEDRVYLWQGHGWQRDRSGIAVRLISELLTVCYEDLVTALEMRLQQEQEGASAKEQIVVLKQTRQAVASRIASLGTMSWIHGTLAFAATLPKLRILSEQWDRNRWLLTCPNGVVDLRTGQASDGKPEDHMRTACPTEWRGLETPAPRFERFLHEIFEDRSPSERETLIAFLQRLLGYALSAQVTEHLITVLYGEQGRNGKDTILHILSYVLGDLATVVSKDVMLDASAGDRAGHATPQLRDLQGKRLTFASEPERGARFHVSQIKEMTGGGQIVARAPYDREMTRFHPTHTLFLLTNHKPHADAHDTAFWDRLILITFNMHFVDAPKGPKDRQKDTHLWTALEQEAPGVLAWLVRGCLEWQRIGLAIPDSVKADSETYRQEEDNIQLFLNECCITGESVQVRSNVLYQGYKSWCRDGNLQPYSHKNFGVLLAAKGFTKTHTREGSVYHGVSLMPDD